MIEPIRGNGPEAPSLSPEPTGYPRVNRAVAGKWGRIGGRMRAPREIRHTGVVKIQSGSATGVSGACDKPGDRTRDAVARTILERGPQNAADLAHRLGLSPAGIRRHLDALVADGFLVEREPRRSASRGRGRPARTYALTDDGRAAFPHAYDDLASTALRYLRETGGDEAVTAFAEHRAATLATEVAQPRRPEPGAARSVRGPRLSADRQWLRFDRPGRPRRRRQHPGHPDLPAPLPGGARRRRSSRSCARPRPGRSSRSSAPTSSAWPPSPTATASAPRTSPFDRRSTAPTKGSQI